MNIRTILAFAHFIFMFKINLFKSILQKFSSFSQLVWATINGSWLHGSAWKVKLSSFVGEISLTKNKLLVFFLLASYRGPGTPPLKEGSRPRVRKGGMPKVQMLCSQVRTNASHQPFSINCYWMMISNDNTQNMFTCADSIHPHAKISSLTLKVGRVSGL